MTQTEAKETPAARLEPAVAVRDAAHRTGHALELHYRFILWLVPALDRFPRTQRFLLGDRIQRTALDVLESLVEATYTRRRSPPARANLGIGGREMTSMPLAFQATRRNSPENANVHDPE